MSLPPHRLQAQIRRYKEKYSHINPKDFVGRFGGAYRYSYPVDTPARAIAALAYARHAPNPQGIRDAVYRIAKRKGWLRPNGTIRRS